MTCTSTYTITGQDSTVQYSTGLVRGHVVLRDKYEYRACMTRGHYKNRTCEYATFFQAKDVCKDRTCLSRAHVRLQESFKKTVARDLSAFF
jgi:hypothetical protein